MTAELTALEAEAARLNVEAEKHAERAEAAEAELAKLRASSMPRATMLEILSFDFGIDPTKLDGKSDREVEDVLDLKIGVRNIQRGVRS